MAVDPNMYVIKPFFQARSFDEMVKPLTLAAAAYKEQEAKLEDMTDKASALEWIANRDPNSQTAALYREMSDKIQGIRDDIMMNGFHGGIRPSILDTRKIYSANSAEITRRYNDMAEYQKRMEQLSDKDNSMVFSTDSENISIDDFAGGRRPKIKAISGNEIMARGAAIGKRLTSQIFGDGVEGQVMGGQFWKMYKEQGMTDTALRAALKEMGKSDKYAMVKEVIDGVYNSFNGFSPENQRQLKNRFIEGVYSGAVYAKDVSYQVNEDHVNPIEREQIRASQISTQLAQNQDRRQEIELDATMRANGYEPEVVDKNGTVLKWKPGPNGVTTSGNKNSSSSNSGGNSSSGRVGQRKGVYMKNDDDGPHDAGYVNGQPVNEKGELVDKGLDVTFVEEDGNIVMYSGVMKLGTYNPNDDTVENPIGDGNSKVLRQLGREAHKASMTTPGGTNALANYTGKFKKNTSWLGNNASMYFGPAIDVVYPSYADVAGQQLQSVTETPDAGNMQ